MGKCAANDSNCVEIDKVSHKAGFQFSKFSEPCLELHELQELFYSFARNFISKVSIGTSETLGTLGTLVKFDF